MVGYSIYYSIFRFTEKAFFPCCFSGWQRGCTAKEQFWPAVPAVTQLNKKHSGRSRNDIKLLLQCNVTANLDCVSNSLHLICILIYFCSEKHLSTLIDALKEKVLELSVDVLSSHCENWTVFFTGKGNSSRTMMLYFLFHKLSVSVSIVLSYIVDVCLCSCRTRRDKLYRHKTETIFMGKTALFKKLKMKYILAQCMIYLKNFSIPF